MTAVSDTTETVNTARSETEGGPKRRRAKPRQADKAPRQAIARDQAIDGAVTEMLTETSKERPAPSHAPIPRPEDAHPDCYGLRVDGDGAGPRFPAGSFAIIEPVPPRARDYAVAYLTDRETPSIWQMGDTFTPDMLLVGEGSTVFPLIEMFAPETGRRGHLDVRRFDKLHRIHSAHIPDGVVRRHLPDDLPIMDEAPEGCIEHRITDACNYPVLRQGDVALVDITKTELRDGALCLLKWDSGSCAVLQTNHREMGSAGLTWLVDPINRPGPDVAAKTGCILFASDGPYDADNLASKIVGEVVGILAPGRAGKPDGVAIEYAGLRKLPPSVSTQVMSVAEAIDAHTFQREALNKAAAATDEVAVKKAGGDTSLEAMAPANAAYEQVIAAETEAWWRVVDAEPKSDADLIKKLDYIAQSPALRDGEEYEYILDGIRRNVQSLVVRRTDADRNSLVVETPPDGFVAYPFDKPTSFLSIRYIIPIEAARLLRIAEDDLARRSSFHDGSPDVVDRIRRSLHIDALRRLAGVEPTIDAGDDTSALAAASFEPVERNSPCPIPSRADWMEDAERMLPWLRIGWLLLTLDRDALVKHLEAETDESFTTCLDALRRASSNLDQMRRVAETAISRIVIGSAILAERASASETATAEA